MYIMRWNKDYTFVLEASALFVQRKVDEGFFPHMKHESFWHVPTTAICPW